MSQEKKLTRIETGLCTCEFPRTQILEIIMPKLKFSSFFFWGGEVIF